MLVTNSLPNIISQKHIKFFSSATKGDMPLRQANALAGRIEACRHEDLAARTRGACSMTMHLWQLRSVQPLSLFSDCWSEPIKRLTAALLSPTPTQRVKVGAIYVVEGEGVRGARLQSQWPHANEPGPEQVESSRRPTPNPWHVLPNKDRQTESGSGTGGRAQKGHKGKCVTQTDCKSFEIRFHNYGNVINNPGSALAEGQML